MTDYSTRDSYNEEKDPLGPKIAAWLTMIIIVYLVVAQ